MNHNHNQNISYSHPQNQSSPASASSSSHGTGGTGTAAASAPLRTRQRARKACLPCRQRKRKCDNRLPCSMCTTYGYKCQYAKDQAGAGSYAKSPSPAPARTASHDYVHGNSRKRVSFSSANHGHNHDDNSSSGGSPAPVEPGILDPFKSRYMSQHSAVAFPRTLGLDLRSTTILPLHSFAWNCGVRPEEKAVTHFDIRELISHEELVQFSKVYFTHVNVIFGVLDQQDYNQRCEKYWGSTSPHITTSPDVVFAAVMGSVVALGSFFSLHMGHARELDIVEYVKNVLEDPAYSRLPSVDQITAWILRTLYLRATTRPHVAWLASSITLHLAEATGLHHEVNSVRLTTADSPINDSSSSLTSNRSGTERARRIFWIAWSNNMLISYEYGRSAVTLSSITCHPPAPSPNDYTTMIISIAQSLVHGEPNIKECYNRRSELYASLEQLASLPDDHPFISLAKADMAFGIYRRLRLIRQGIEPPIAQTFISLGNRALAASLSFAQDGIPWWNVLYGPFQYVCVLLAIDSAESLAQVTSALETLEKICNLLNTHLAIEAITTAKLLVQDSVKKKKAELKLLGVDEVVINSSAANGGGAGSGETPSTITGGSSGAGDMDGVAGGVGMPIGEMNWDEFFNPAFGNFWDVQGGGGLGTGVGVGLGMGAQGAGPGMMKDGL